MQAAPPYNKTTFRQRYFLCDEHWERRSDGSRGPIFFYVGNEADVTLYLNATGTNTFKLHRHKPKNFTRKASDGFEG